MKKHLLHILIILFTVNAVAQSIDIENFGKGEKLKITGGISSNFTYFDTGRPVNALQPFTYYVQGNLNFSLFRFSMPVSYSYSNEGDNFNYRIPFNFNRLSLHPKYRWITAHIGDVSMNFSPYTLNGHQFTGGGVEIKLKNGLNLAVMTGRLLKATEDDGDSRTMPAFNRMGYGTKVGYEKEKYKINISGFYAKDDINSLSFVPEEKKVLPKENLTIGIEGSVQLYKNLHFKLEYGTTAITQDLRSDNTSNKNKNFSGLFINATNSTEYFTALKTGINYKINKTVVSLMYEKIDPGYQTLGAYYFNNDLENVTLNAAQPMFNNKLNLQFNLGYQRDNLDLSKLLSTNRMVGSVNFNLRATDKLNITGNYSNFSTYSNKSLNKLEEINQMNLTPEEIRQLDYKQLSQNANLNVNWVFSQSKTKTQNFNLNYSLASTTNQQGDIIAPGQQNNFHNFISSYNLSFPQQQLSFSASLNYIYNDMGIDQSKGTGGNLQVAKRLFDKKLNSNFSAGYNRNNDMGGLTQVYNFKLGLSLSLNKHQFSLRAIELIRNMENKDDFNEFRLNFGYNYSFDLLKKGEKNAKKAIK
jgi:hypothetical protein